MRETKVWAVKHRDDRKNAILQILEKQGEMLMADLIRNHYEEIGVALSPDGKIMHQAWEVVRNDCKHLEKEGKIVISKNKLGKLMLFLTQQENKIQELPKIPAGKITLQPSTLEAYTTPEMMDIISSINALNEKVAMLKNEILEIWKHLSKISIKETKPSNEKTILLSSLQEIINKLK